MPKRKIKKTSEDEYSGLLLGFEPRRTSEIKDYLSQDYAVTESLSSVDWDLEQREVALLVLDLNPPQISGAALLERARGAAGTKKLRMRFIENVLWSPLPFLSFGAWANDLADSPEHVFRLQLSHWHKALNVIRANRPEEWKRLADMLVEREKTRRLSGASQHSLRLSEQRDALGLALDIAALGRAEVLESLQVEDEASAKSVLDLIDTLPVQERSLVEHDARIFPMVLEADVETALFSGARDQRQVRIYVADKGKLETKLGIDLLVYQSRYNSFLLLQYKGMEYAPCPEGWSYVVDGMLKTQVDRMNDVRSRLRKDGVRKPNIWGMRLNGEPFYFKFCERMSADSLGRELVGGMTISCPHLMEFLSCKEAADGRTLRVGYRNCLRYLTNTDFVSLARGGWIGSEPFASKILSELIAELRRSGRSQVFAVVDSKERAAGLYRQSLRGGGDRPG